MAHGIVLFSASLLALILVSLFFAGKKVWDDFFKR